jgi:hypothetical protein
MLFANSLPGVIRALVVRVSSETVLCAKDRLSSTLVALARVSTSSVAHRKCASALRDTNLSMARALPSTPASQIMVAAPPCLCARRLGPAMLRFFL